MSKLCYYINVKEIIPTNQPQNEERKKQDLTIPRRTFLVQLAATGAGAFGLHKLTKNLNEPPEIVETEEEVDRPVVEEIKPEPKREVKKTIENPYLKEYQQVKAKLYEEWPREELPVNKRLTVSAQEFKDTREPFPYENIFPKPEYPNVVPFGQETRFGNSSEEWRMIEAYKFQLLTQAVERKYNLPPNLLLAMMIKESGASEFLTNAKGDGGAGLIHMQPSTAVDYKLRTYKNCHSLICDGVSEHCCTNSNDEKSNHAKDLRDFINAHKDNRQILATNDERLHHLANIDAAGRMLAFYIQKWTETNTIPGLGPMRNAIAHYCGLENYKAGYVSDVIKLMKDLGDPEVIDRLKGRFEKKEGGTSFNQYIDDWQKYMANYGLFDYVRGACYFPKNTDKILSSYQAI